MQENLIHLDDMLLIKIPIDAKKLLCGEGYRFVQSYLTLNLSYLTFKSVIEGFHWCLASVAPRGL